MESSKKTIHPLIFEAKESFIKPKKLWPKLNELNKLIIENRENEVLSLLKLLVPEWERK